MIDPIISHALPGTIVGVATAFGGLKLWPVLASLVNKREESKAKVEIEKMKHEDRQTTGQHKALNDAALLAIKHAEHLVQRLDVTEKNHAECLLQQDQLRVELQAVQKHVRDWEDRASSSELTFQTVMRESRDVMRRAEDCEKNRAVDQSRMTALEQEMRALQRAVSTGR